ncbi:MAG: hypothetical protein GEV12_23590, partial [Micromonosporaceae bacterium]|nr:hypothetical protein [Micromonosporaceae bacterium]
MVASSQPTLTANPDLVADDELTRIAYFDPGWVRRSDDAGDPRVVIRYEHTAQGWQTARTPVDPDTGEDVTDEAASWAHLPDGLLAERADLAGNKATYTYDPNGNLLEASDGTNLVQGEPIQIAAAYDSLNRPTLARHREADTDTPGDAGWQASASTYDANGNVVERVDDADWDPTTGQP